MTWADTERGHGPVGKAIRTRELAVFRDVTHDPDFAPWRAEALRRGYAAVVGIPLLSGSEVLGALAITAAEPDAFDEDEVQLLRELADDLSYGIVALRTRTACQGAEEALRRAHDELERRVEERTAELSRANTLLTREIADRERAEAACGPRSSCTASSRKGSSKRSSWPTSGAGSSCSTPPPSGPSATRSARSSASPSAS